jgi:magnesium-transporting ATPase (P-type)
MYEFHASTAKNCFEVLGCEPEGLTAPEATARLKKYGTNTLPKPKERSSFLRFLAQFNNVLIYVLLAVPPSSPRPCSISSIRLSSSPS